MRWRRIVLITGIIVLAAGLGAAGWGLLIYNEATKIDRSDPEVVTDDFLRATLIRKDNIGADLYACEDQSRLRPIKALREELNQRERDFGVTVVVSWGRYTKEADTLITELTVAAHKAGNEQSSSKQHWRFSLQNDNGWRVCGAERLEDNPG